ncbi:MAG: hypothetical protein OEQ30_02550 [Gammaproteobacteria bacterium]|jgi:hypothetical protein|nr:hypothetical protein [Gammaproteobacteria bacterium]MDH3846513.1 hypothetical protein [Gammaproteobacteria bacterium]MDH3904769.1 hypothetical protein [Gammaproteobacteria bacterium]MDH4003520.1 hypothetical protein [Gammaproteobacteria bacterium]NCF58872.1 hypothetical protein [Gammaproteobacteria bacterium]
MGLRTLFRRTWIKVSLIVAGMLLLAFLAVALTWSRLFIPSPPEADFDAPANQTEAYRQDLDYLARYVEYEKSLEDESKAAAFLDAVKAAHADLEGMTPARFELVVARAVAQTDNAHSSVSPISRTRRVNHLPVRVGPLTDGYFVIQTTREHADLLGAEIVAVEGQPVTKVVDAFLQYFGGPEQRRRFFSHLFLTSPALLHAEGITASPDAATLRFALPDGGIVERRLDALPPAEGRREPYGREVIDYRVPQEDADDWIHLMSGETPPLYLSEPDEPYLYEFLEEENGGYVRINFNADVDGRSLVDWLEGVAVELAGRRPAFAVVDLRFNGGGTDATSRFAKELPELVANGGPIYVLTSPQTFSAAVMATAQFKEFGGEQVKVVGGAAGDRMRFVANGGTPFTLPNSGIMLRVWSTWEDVKDGCWDWTDCFWLSPYFRNPGVATLEPDIPVPFDFEDYRAGRDAALEAALADAKRITGS